jgi:hypothetical protein
MLDGLYSLKRRILRPVSRLPGTRLLRYKVAIGSLGNRVYLGNGRKSMYRSWIYSAALLAGTP